MSAVAWVCVGVALVWAVSWVIREIRWWEWARCRMLLLEAANEGGPLTSDEAVRAHAVIERSEP